ncbi:MAG: hypothetical protein E6G97_09835 [Alphaproteobacteria bacterium]|nr:MAG: hypothetical protein E6G97_09835 [Alphaproteobacteria bacterium]
MDKYLASFSSSNPITGPMLVTTSPRASCPLTCPLKGTDCYAEHGFLGGFIWSGLDAHYPGESFSSGIRVYNFDQLLRIISSLAPGAPWRHNQAGDLIADRNGNIDSTKLRLLAWANRGKLGITYTHHDVLNNAHNRRVIQEAIADGFTVNLSADSIEEADAFLDLDIAPVAVIIEGNCRENFFTPKGRKVVICPARTRDGVTCSTCRLCARNRNVVVGLPKL